jgi:hypothetical protein
MILVSKSIGIGVVNEKVLMSNLESTCLGWLFI